MVVYGLKSIRVWSNLVRKQYILYIPLNYIVYYYISIILH